MFAKMWFNCIACGRTKLKNKKTYTVIAQGDGYSKEMHMCCSCGDVINSLYVTASENVKNRDPDE